MGVGYNRDLKTKNRPWNKGKKMSLAYRKKLSESHKGSVGFWKGKKRPEETRKKISEALIGKRLSESTKNKIRRYQRSSASFQKSEEGRKFASQCAKRRIYGPVSDEQRKRLGDISRGRTPSLSSRRKISQALRGKKHYNWKGGITKRNAIIRRSLKYRLWREAVFKRDGYVCVVGGQRHGSKLNADHIKPFALYPSLRFVLENGRTLCVSCHEKTDSYRRKFKKSEYPDN